MFQKIRNNSGKIYILVINCLLAAVGVLLIREKDQTRLQQLSTGGEEQQSETASAQDSGNNNVQLDSLESVIDPIGKDTSGASVGSVGTGVTAPPAKKTQPIVPTPNTTPAKTNSNKSAGSGSSSSGKAASSSANNSNQSPSASASNQSTNSNRTTKTS